MLDDDKVAMHLKQQPDMFIRHDIRTPIDHNNCNLPIIANTACIMKELDVVEPHFKSSIASFNHKSVFTDHQTVEVNEIKCEIDFYFKMCCPCVGVEENANLTDTQKELLLWHCKLGESMHWIQELMHVHTSKEPNRKHSLMPTVIKPKFASTSNCPVQKCMSFELAHAKKHNPQVVCQQAIKEKEDFFLGQIPSW